jgi:ACS family tartrate transporter-like MFS transporter
MTHSPVSSAERASDGVSNIDHVVAKVTRRLVPFLVVCYVAAYLDRVNVGFAALSMNQALGFSPVVFGWGAGIFFLGYAVFEVPSNLILHRVGARLWIARIMVSWGFVSALMAFTFDMTSFLALRFLLGLAEAGFAPGILLYLTYWIPAEHRAKVFAAFLVGIPLSTLVGAPISGLVLATMDGVAGLANWQWLFIIEAIPSILLGIVAFFVLIDRPRDALWLTPEERNTLQARLDREQVQLLSHRGLTASEALRHPLVLVLSLAYFGIVTSLYGLGFWLPQMIEAFGIGPFGTGLLTAIPYLCGLASMVLWSKRADRTADHARHVVVATIVAAGGLVASAMFQTPGLLVAALSISAIGTLAAIPVFWALPMTFLSRAGAAAGIALINSIGNLAGFAGPFLVGWIKAATDDYASALFALALGPLASALIIHVTWKLRASAAAAVDPAALQGGP